MDLRKGIKTILKKWHFWLLVIIDTIFGIKSFDNLDFLSLLKVILVSFVFMFIVYLIAGLFFGWYKNEA